MTFEEKKEEALKLGINFPHNILEETLTKKIEEIKNNSIGPVKKVQMEMFYKGQRSVIDVIEDKVEAHKKHGWKVV